MEQTSPKTHKTTLKEILLLQLAVLLFSVSSVLSKFAAQYGFLSWNWILFYGASLFLLGVYAVAWQQFLKNIPLTTAYANRAMAMLWSMVFGTLVFQETIKWNMVLGVAVIAAGIFVVVTADAE